MTQPGDAGWPVLTPRVAAVAPEDPPVVGPYRVEGVLGEGGAGRVFLARTPAGGAVAVKVLHRELADSAFRERLEHEVALSRAAHGLYAVPVVAADVWADRPWLATAYVPGASLQRVVDESGPLPVAVVARLTAAVAEALQSWHAAGVVHGDLKASNVLLTADGPRVIDSTIARAAETHRGDEPTGAADVFALGVLVGFAATGRPDLEGCPPALRDLASACLAKDPAHRPSPAEIIERCQTAADTAAPTPPASAAPASPTPVPFAALIQSVQDSPTAPGPPTPASPTASGPPTPASPTVSGSPMSVSPTAPGPPTPVPPIAPGPPTPVAFAALVQSLQAPPTAPGPPTAAPPTAQVPVGVSNPPAASAALVWPASTPAAPTPAAPTPAAPGSAAVNPVSSAPAAPPPHTPAPPRTHTRRNLLLAAGAVGVVGLGFAIGAVLSDGDDAGPEAGGGTPPGSDGPFRLAATFADPRQSLTSGLHLAAFSPDGRLLATAGVERVLLWDVASGEQRGELTGHTDFVFGLAFSPDGALFATASHDGTARLWEVDGGRPRAVLSGHAGRLTDVAFSPDGLLLATSSEDRTIRLWDVTGRERAVLAGHNGDVRALAFHPDGRSLASASSDGSVIVWNVADGQPVSVLTGHTGAGMDVAFNPDGTVLAASDAGGPNGNVILWDTAAGRQIAVLDDFEEPVSSVAFSPDGTLLATGAERLAIWDVASRERRAALDAHDDIGIRQVVFGPTGVLASSGWDGKVRLWEIG